MKDTTIVLKNISDPVFIKNSNVTLQSTDYENSITLLNSNMDIVRPITILGNIDCNPQFLGNLTLIGDSNLYVLSNSTQYLISVTGCVNITGNLYISNMDTAPKTLHIFNASCINGTYFWKKL